MPPLAVTLADALSRGDAAAIDDAWDDHWSGDRAASEVEVTDLPLNLLHDLLLGRGHHLHQQIAREIQDRRDASSIPIVRQMLERGFADLSYTASDDEVIAKWFGHILAGIGTADAVATIRDYAASSNAGIAAEMRYRLARIEGRERP